MNYHKYPIYTYKGGAVVPMKCYECGKPIEKGQRYYAKIGTEAHVDCVNIASVVL